ncbi:DUF4178 domain-containing protein [Chryseobacterium nepalense]|uniref:DUF4178 domain-containing protein n=1 Tax=Chryseobacterium nepalense TaxID=1854498 RepID=A0ABY4K2L5_9FLAO|nr:DUF4178 domain-containing protein [Chryseobacterium nepalense]UPQ75031.1 DUF4178 domain-containing protein [Chryseobacterium nepalense]
MHYICPVCKTENTIDADFEISEYVCKSCSNLIDISKNISAKVVKKPVESVVLEVGQKGIIDGTDYTVTGIIIRKYGSTVFWREYYLKDKKGGNAFLSESDGHWVFLHVINAMDVKKKLNDKVAEFHMKNYRWYETTQCTIHAAAGFFEDSLNFSISNYKEYVNGTQMISQEQSGSNTEFFFGKHISKYKVKKAFNILSLPNYSGIGIVQPFYVNVTQAINILAVSALIICLIQLYVVGTRTNALVFEQEINFADVADKEMVSKSFELSGGSAPLNVEVSSNVDNSWANVGLGLVNEKNNEIVFASKDIEQYHGYEDGENWSEGSQRESFNFCGVAPGNYHFVISAERQEPLKTSQPAKYISPDGNLSISREENGTVSVTNQSTFETTSFGDAKMIKKDSVSTLGQLVHKILGKADIDSLLNANAQAESISATSENKSVKIKAEWLPVSFRNFAFVLLFLIALVLGLYFGRRAFERSKWFNSSNSPYTYS